MLGWSVRKPLCLAAVTCFVSDGGIHRVVFAPSHSRRRRGWTISSHAPFDSILAGFCRLLIDAVGFLCDRLEKRGLISLWGGRSIYWLQHLVEQ